MSDDQYDPSTSRILLIPFCFLAFKIGITFWKVVYDPVIGHAKDGAGVLIDGNDGFRALHGCYMLEGTADANGNTRF